MDRPIRNVAQVCRQVRNVFGEVKQVCQLDCKIFLHKERRKCNLEGKPGLCPRRGRKEMSIDKAE